MVYKDILTLQWFLKDNTAMPSQIVNIILYFLRKQCNVFSNIEIQWLGSNAITLANSSCKPIMKSSKCTNVPSIPDI